MNKHYGLVNNEYIPAPADQLQQGLAAHLRVLGFETMAKEALATESDDRETLKRFAKIIVHNFRRENHPEATKVSALLNTLRLI